MRKKQDPARKRLGKPPISHWSPLLPSGNNRAIQGVSGWGRISPLGIDPHFLGLRIRAKVQVSCGAGEAA